jgi:mono/diheme cytochrome c family protein
VNRSNGAVQRVIDLLTRRWWLTVLVLAVGLFAVIQLVPYRVDNPPVVNEPNWDSPQTRALAVAACFDCHSNESKPLWFEKVAPLSWWITNHVKEGRSALNFSEWGTSGQGESDDIVEAVRNGGMPPSNYTWFGLHNAAQLTPKQRQQLADGLQATLAQSGSRRGG